MTGSGANKHTLVVVFGAAVRPDGSASPALARRVGYAAAVAQADPSVDLFLSGGVGRFPPSEARVMAGLLDGAVSIERLVLDEVSADTLQTVRAAAAYARRHSYAAVRTCTDAYHQPRIRMLFGLMGLATRPVRMIARGPRQLQARMWVRELAAVPYDAVAGVAAVWRDSGRRRANRTADEPEHQPAADNTMGRQADTPKPDAIASPPRSRDRRSRL